MQRHQTNMAMLRQRRSNDPIGRDWTDTLDVVERLFDTGEAPRGANVQADRGRAARGAHAAAGSRRASPVRSICSAADRRCGRRSSPGTLHSMILYGPPGSGKTTLARIAASQHRRGIRGGKRGQRRARGGAGGDRARPSIGRRANGTADRLLPRRDPSLQQGAAGRSAAGGRGRPLTLIGATTENPYFEVNSALLSRAQIYELRRSRRSRSRRCCGAPSATRSAASRTRPRSRTR